MSHPNVTNDTVVTEDENDDDDVTIIYLEEENNAVTPMNFDTNTATVPEQPRGVVFEWFERSDGTILQDERRRAILIQELKRVQRTACIQFSILCLLPVLLFVAMAIAVLGQDETCESTLTECTLEPRTFVNAYTTRCVCQPIPVALE